MRYVTICLLGFATLTAACQPITPSSMSITLADPKGMKPTSTQALAKTISINNSQNKSQTKIELIVEPTKKSPISDSQDGSQTEIKLAVGEISSSKNANSISKNLESVVPQMVLIEPKVFNPKDVMDLTIPLLIQDLGKATITRQEGPVEIWQYHFKNCVVDFFFYSTNEFAPKLTARSWDMRSAMIGSNLDRAACLAEMNIYHQDVLTK
ncbi:hypothetical protein N8500_00515 [Candidatus Puniceispirillum sp.]|nr:hypothetical protein [Candidatus Puniceispirillum sp.]